ncbi:DNA-binding protein [Endozoicomonas sp. YOMI1]|uniref:baseplate complex protein n=1 Tax=Endozoicomonas sp. YOMI1 TaxID=2828739 RepID=UPI002148D090|nr:DNA-binding protein [Endozoicomonas sp. YOMI1]
MQLNNTVIKGQGITVSAALVIDTEELGAQSSSTDRAQKGFKPKKLTVNMEIRQKDHKDLSRLLSLAESVDSNGRQTVYNILDNTAKAMKIRQVTFIDNVRVTEIADRRAWSVSFMLAEYYSIPEKKEARQEPVQPIAQTTAGSTPVEPVAQQQGQQPGQPNYTGFEKILAAVEEMIS